MHGFFRCPIEPILLDGAMIGTLRNAPRMADWRFNGMSVCICVLCRDVANYDRRGQQIIFVEDRKVTFTDFSADNAVTKNSSLIKNWWVQYAGNDVDKAQLVIEAAREKTTGGRTQSPQLIAKALQESWSEFRDREIETKILRKHGFSFKSFREQGRDKCTESVYDELHDRIDKFKWSLEFLLAGFDKDGDAHLLGIATDGTVSSYSELGFWAIGSGSHAALSSLSFHVEHNNLCSYCSCAHNAVYFGCEAKFMAETSVEVGKESTLVAIHKKNEREPQFFFNPEVEQLKKSWLKYGAPKPCERVMKQIYDFMKKPPSVRSSSRSRKRVRGHGGRVAAP